MDLPLSSAEQSALFAAFDRSHGIIVFDRDGTILSANDVFLAMMGYGREIIGRKLSCAEVVSTAASSAAWPRMAARSG